MYIMVSGPVNPDDSQKPYCADLEGFTNNPTNYQGKKSLPCIIPYYKDYKNNASC